MVDIKVNNELKSVDNNLFVRGNLSNVDFDYWYMELYGKFPVYQLTVDINRNDEDEDFDIYNKIYEDLVATGKFTVLKYEYGYEKTNIPNSKAKEEKKYVTSYCMIYNDEPVMVYCEFENLTIVSYQDTDIIEKFNNDYLKKYDETSEKVKCSIIVKEQEMYLSNFDIDLEYDLDFDLYNEGFKNVHDTIIKSINNDKNGLYFLYGKPGTGKTTYIRHIIKECTTEKRKFIYVPIKLFEDFTDPGVLPFLLRNKGCVYIIEDCESLVTVDDGIRSDSITDLLNMTDGLLADALDIKIICTFNSDYDKIDEALLRPGRCKCKYEFDLLDKTRANKAAKKYGLKKVDHDVSIAELFNPDIEFVVEDKKKKIGF